jgi:thymidylate synthase (FAD)
VSVVPHVEIANEIADLIADDPALYVLARPVINFDQVSSFLKDVGVKWERSRDAKPAEDLIEFAGRICYMSFGSDQSRKTNQEYIHHLIKQQHESVLEHASWTFLLTGVSRAFTHQLVRHRVGFSFSQLSQQYHDEAGAKYVMPEEIKKHPALVSDWIRLIAGLRREYVTIAANLNPNESEQVRVTKEKQRAIRSAARTILPNATETKIVFSANGRALRHFLAKRGAIVGDLEMRRVAALVHSQLMLEAPAILSGFTSRIHEDGYPIVNHVKE